MNELNFLEIKPILESIFEDTVSQKLTFRIHRRLLRRFWKAMQQNIRWYSNALDIENGLADSLQALIDDLNDLL